MKKTIIIGFLAQIALIIGCSKTTDNEYIERVLSNLKLIESARYFSISSSSVPNDNSAFITYRDYVFEFTNPVDTFIGAGYINMDIDDTSKIKSIYDGNIMAHFNWDDETIEIDNFIGYPEKMPRPIMSPFFNNVKSIVGWAKGF